MHVARWLLAMAVVWASISLARAAPLAAQDGVRTWGVAGAGMGFAGGGPETDTAPGLAGHLGLRHQRGPFLLSARLGIYQGGKSPERIPGGLRDRFDEVAVLGGYTMHRTEASQVVVSAGLAAVSGERVEPCPDIGLCNVSFGTRVGVPIQIAMWGPTAATGFGLAAHANVNPEEVFGAVTVTYVLGLGGDR